MLALPGVPGVFCSGGRPVSIRGGAIGLQRTQSQVALCRVRHTEGVPGMGGIFWSKSHGGRRVGVGGVVLATLLAAVGSPLWSSAAAGVEPAQVTLHAAESAPLADGSASAEALALAQAAETGQPVEVVEAATETETLVANPSGTLTRTIAAAPVRTVDESGELVDIDTTLQVAGETLEPVATPAEVELSASGGGAVLAQVAPGASGGDGDFSIGLGYEAQLDAPKIAGSTAVYTEDENTAVRVEVVDQGFAAHVMLAEAPMQAAVYRFPLTLEGVTASLTDGVLQFTDGEGAVVAESSLLRMWDSQVDAYGDPSNVVPVAASLVDDGGEGQVLELRPSMEFLASPGTQYPVTVDPDITLDPGADAYFTDAAPNAGFSSDYKLHVGSNNGTNRYRSFVNFDTSEQAGLAVVNAKLRLYQYGAGSCDPKRMDVLMATSDWAGTGRTWNTQPSTVTSDSRYATTASFNASAGGGGQMAACGGAAWQSVDVTPQISAWVESKATRWGLVMATAPAHETNIAHEKRFCSKNVNATGVGYCQQARPPELLINYTLAPALTQPISVAGPGPGWTDTLRPSLGVTYADPDSATVDVTFSVLDAGQVIWSTVQPSVPRGQPISVTVPDGVLQFDQRFSVRTSASDGYATSVPSQSEIIIAQPCEIFDADGLPRCTSGEEPLPNVDAEEGAYFGPVPENPVYVDVDPSIDQTAIPSDIWDRVTDRVVPSTAELTEASSNSVEAQTTGSEGTTDSTTAKWATCKVRADLPHWSKKGKTVLTKVWSKCWGNYGPSVTVNVTCWLWARQDADSTPKAVAVNLEARVVPLTGKWEDAAPVYCPNKGGANVKGNGRLFRGLGKLEITSPGLKTDPGYHQSAWSNPINKP